LFDLSLPKILILVVLALIVFGPHELPKMASRAGQALRELRRIADGAKADVRAGLGPEFADFDLADLNPRRFAQKHLFSPPDGLAKPGTDNGTMAAAPGPRPAEETAFDPEAT
jgi:sec-independent protein translocase protein TatB